MAGFRKRFVRRRFRRSRFDMMSQTLCQEPLLVRNFATQDSTCAAPIQIATLVGGPGGFPSLSQASNKGSVFGGMHMQLEYNIAPEGTYTGPVANAVIPVSIWTALMVLPVQPGTATPTFLPAFTALLNQFDGSGDLLWKRLDILQVQDVSAFNYSITGVPFMDSTYGKHDPIGEVIRTRRRVLDNEGLFLVHNIVDGVSVALGAGGGYGLQLDGWLRFAVAPIMR